MYQDQEVESMDWCLTAIKVNLLNKYLDKLSMREICDQSEMLKRLGEVGRVKGCGINVDDSGDKNVKNYM